MRQIFTITIFLVLAIFHAVPVLGEEGTYCCTSKTVGTYAYTLLETEVAQDTLGCQSPCVYQRDGEPGSRYCFKNGDLPVTCSTEALFIPIITIFNDLNAKIAVGIVLNNGKSTSASVPSNTKEHVNIGQTTVKAINAQAKGFGLCKGLRNPPAIKNNYYVKPCKPPQCSTKKCIVE